MSMMPGPFRCPSTVDWYFRDDGMPSAWQKSSCGRRRKDSVSSPLPVETLDHQNPPRAECLDFGVVDRKTQFPKQGEAVVLVVDAGRHVDLAGGSRSIVPISGFRMCVVGVVPFGRIHCPSTRVRAVFSCAPATEMRNACSGSFRWEWCRGWREFPRSLRWKQVPH